MYTLTPTHSHTHYNITLTHYNTLTRRHATSDSFLERIDREFKVVVDNQNRAAEAASASASSTPNALLPSVYRAAETEDFTPDWRYVAAAVFIIVVVFPILFLWLEPKITAPPP
eukprot:m.53149 g.53149  ORF g.53149 m.53149 type:complete len:114 (-) comp15394_c0_seq3:25-366(-)